MYIEITKDAFNCLVSDNEKCLKTENLELANKFHYRSRGCNLLIINNFIGQITQYYIYRILTHEYNKKRIY